MDVYVEPPQWVVTGTPRPDKPRLYCFPHGGGSVAEYVRWSRALPEFEVCGIQLPGRGSRLREAAITDMDALVAAMADKISFGGRGRFAFFGHSLGALIAYEVARELRARGRNLPETLVLSGCRAPCRPRSALRPVRDLPDVELLTEVNRRHGGFPAEVLAHPELRAMVAGNLRADYRLLETYRWRDDEPLPMPLTVLGGIDDVVRPADLHAWQRHTAAPVSVRTFPGGHFYLREHSAGVHGAILDTLAPALQRAA
jgi:surfactin synthase thioesterase subunit